MKININNNYFKIIYLLFDSILFSKEKGFSHRCIHKCWYMAFLISFIIIIINSITRGMYTETVNSLNFMHADLRINLKKNTTKNKILLIINKIKELDKKNEITSIEYFGIHSGFILTSSNITPNIILIGNDYIKNFLKNKNLNYELKGNKVLFGNGLLNKNIIKKNQKTDCIFEISFNKKKSKLKYEKINIIFNQEINFDFDDLNEKIVIINEDSFNRIFEKPSYNYICIKFKKNNTELENKYKKEILKIISCNIYTLKESYKSLYEGLLIEKTCSNLICFLLLIMSSILLFNLLNIFFIQKKKELSFYKILGINDSLILILCFLLSFFTISIFSFFGSISSYYICKILHIYKLIPIAMTSFNLYVPFDPSLNTLKYILFFQGFICFIILIKIYRSINKNSLYLNIKS